MRRPRRDRWINMADLAELMKLQQKDRRVRRTHVIRLLRRLENRDGTTYLRRFGGSRNSPLYVSVSALEQLHPWDPGTLSAIRGDLDSVGTRVKRLERRVKVHNREIVRIDGKQRKMVELLSEIVSR